MVVSGFGRTTQDRTTRDQPAAPTFRTEANYVRVDAFPTINEVPVGDLRQDEVEILENNAPQKIEQFEHVVIRGGVPQELRREPNTVAESRQMLTDSRARVFVVFLDFYHVEVEASHDIRTPLVEALDRMIGENDLVGVMTPEMSARDVTFARKTTTIDGMLTRYWHWGERGTGPWISKDPEDEQYKSCYPGLGPDPTVGGCKDDDRGVAEQMIDRRREKLTIDALQDLVLFLRGLREERKAILAISDGWLLYRPDARLMRRMYCQAPGTPQIGIDPRSGRLTTKEPTPQYATAYKCDSDRTRLAQIDDEQEFRDILDEANRANASFYPIDPRGLVVFDEPIAKPSPGADRNPLAPGIAAAGLAPITPPSVDNVRLQARITSLRRLAEATDGLAIVGSNDLTGGLRRVVTDLSSYYLLGYYSTGKLDGKFHSVTVRVKRPGVRVCARRGYLAPTVAEVAATAKAAAPAPSGAGSVMASAAAAAVARLPAATRDQPFRAHVVAGWRPGADGQPAAGFWTVGEVADRIPGGELDAVLTSAAGDILSSAHARIASGTTSVLVPMLPNRAIDPGDYLVRVRSQSPSGAEAVSVPISLPRAPHASGAVFIRRGPLTGNKDLPTADLRFRRSDRLRVEIPSTEAAASARLLDRTGKPIPVPVVSATRDDADGSRWSSAEVALAPLAPGDYVIELAGRSDEAGRAGGAAEDTHTLVAFRVIP